MSRRLTIDQYYMRMLGLVAGRSTCVRRAVGAIIVNDKGQVLATGYNGVPSNMPHCIDSPCEGANDASGDTSRCLAVHAEQNALLQCHNLEDAFTLYVSCTPCFTCAKMICNTDISRIVVATEYADTRAYELFKLAHIDIEVYREPVENRQMSTEELKAAGEASFRLFFEEETKPVGKLDDDGNVINHDEIVARGNKIIEERKKLKRSEGVVIAEGVQRFFDSEAQK